MDQRFHELVILIKNHGKSEAKSETLLNKVEQFIASNQDIEKYLLISYNDFYDTPLMAAIKAFDIELVRFLLHKGVKLVSKRYKAGDELSMYI